MDNRRAIAGFTESLLNQGFRAHEEKVASRESLLQGQDDSGKNFVRRMVPSEDINSDTHGKKTLELVLADDLPAFVVPAFGANRMGTSLGAASRASAKGDRRNGAPSGTLPGAGFRRPSLWMGHDLITQIGVSTPEGRPIILQGP